MLLLSWILSCSNKSAKSGKFCLFSEEFPTNCTTPNDLNGTCKPIASCPSLNKLFKTSPQTMTSQQFLSSSRCEGSSTNFCCPNEVLEDEAKKLKEILSQPPACGQDAPNRIFGGQETEINEFPWTVLLNYKKCE